MAAMKAHQEDPHLSKQDNAAALAGKVSGAMGISAHDDALKATLRVGLLPRLHRRL